MPKVRYAEIIAVFREMEVPEKCPGCGAPLRNEKNLKEPTVRRYDYVLYYTKGQLGKPEDEKVVNETGTQQFDHESGLTIPAHDRVGELPSASADEDISGFMYFCENCACDELLAGDPHAMVHRVENIIPCREFVPTLSEKQNWNDYSWRQLAHAFIDKLGLGEFYKGFLEEFIKKENRK
jgi:hypothetical protein